MNYRGGMWERGGWAGWSGVGGGKWDNCNSIINKYIKKKKELEFVRWGLEKDSTDHRLKALRKERAQTKG